VNTFHPKNEEREKGEGGRKKEEGRSQQSRKKTNKKEETKEREKSTRERSVEDSTPCLNCRSLSNARGLGYDQTHSKRINRFDSKVELILNLKLVSFFHFSFLLS
jgi:phosphatidate phosphatase PAH1